MAQLLVTCEHATNSIPKKFSTAFAGAEEALQSHRGWDPGAADQAGFLSKYLDAPLISGVVSRLLVELNRSPGHPQLWSEFSAALPENEKAALLDLYYLPYRKEVAWEVEKALATSEKCIHLSVHSFTPVWNGQKRETDIGLLFDPSRTAEASFCHKWRELLQHIVPEFRIDDNMPYLGTDDGLTTTLRSAYPPYRYIGIELEVNQRFFFEDPQAYFRITEGLAFTLKAMLAEIPAEQ